MDHNYLNCETAFQLLTEYRADLELGSKAYHAALLATNMSISLSSNSLASDECERLKTLSHHQSFAIQLNNAAITRLCELLSQKEASR